jgi:thiamine-monophosphate kinase
VTRKKNPLRNETEIIERISRAMSARALRKNRDWVRIGVGDDAAAIRNMAHTGATSGDWMLSTDSFLEGVHFLPGVHSPSDIGYKALARATSDLAAMGAAPRFFLLSIALPGSRTGIWLDGFLKGMAQAARKFGMRLIGGDTSRFGPVVINVTVGGQAVGRRAGNVLTRSGARPGDLIFVSGTLGAAQLGLEIILHGLDGRAKKPKIPRGGQWKRLLQPHLRPKIQLELGRWLAGENSSLRELASAAIDTSDGLSTDLNHICKASSMGARIWEEKIPMVQVPESVRQRGFRSSSLDLALHGGEDYQLLFTLPPALARRLPGQYRSAKLTQIGEIVPLKGNSRSSASCVELVTSDGHASPLDPKGWDPFARNSSTKKI